MATREDACWLRLLGITSLLLKKGIITEEEYKSEMNMIIKGMRERNISEIDIKELEKMLSV